MGRLSKVYEISIIYGYRYRRSTDSDEIMGFLISIRRYGGQRRLKKLIDELILHEREKVTPVISKYYFIFVSR